MNGHLVFFARRSDTATSSRQSDWIDAIACRVIEHAARRAPTTLSERLLEEWLADLTDHRGRIARLQFALGCNWAAIQIDHDSCTVSSPTTASAVGDRIVAAHAGLRTPLFSRQTAASGSQSVICEINATPLIDVLLVLLVTLIITLPLMTQAVKVNLPQSASQDEAPPEVINLDIEFDGTVVWNGSPVAKFEQLEGYFRAESRKYPQPEIHLRPAVTATRLCTSPALQ